ncbi:hypothetical protein C8R45DRAFT_1100962 [Mycena sanguinolenta]|nr:hypothetical protein C8R45DRAFT_1100962 [Mycena sanguinolenta]
MENNTSAVILIILGAVALLASSIVLMVHLLRMRARRRYSMEQSILWHFPTLDFRGEQDPPTLPLIPVKKDARTFSWIWEDKFSPSYKAPIEFPEPARVSESRRSSLYDPSLHLP